MKTLIRFLSILLVTILSLSSYTYSQITVNMGDQSAVTTCNALFYDEGGIAGSSTPYVNDTITFYPGVAGAKVTIDFTFLGLDPSEVIQVYDGSDVYSGFLGNVPINGTALFQASIGNASGALTLVHSTEITPGAGWEATVTCFSGSLSITSPSTGDFYSNNNYYYINWNSNSIATSNVKLYYSTDNQVTWNYISTVGNMEGSNNYYWYVSIPDGEYPNSYVLVTSEDSVVTSVSNMFTLSTQSQIIISYPGNGDVLQGGSYINYKLYNKGPAVYDASLYYSEPGFTYLSSITYIGYLASGETDIYAWVPNYNYKDSFYFTLYYNGDYRANSPMVRIKGIPALSINNPQSYYEYKWNSNLEIKFNTNNIDSVNIEYWDASVGQYFPIDSNYHVINGLNIYNWTTPNGSGLSSAYEIKISDASNASYNSIVQFYLNDQSFNLLTDMSGLTLTGGDAFQIQVVPNRYIGYLPVYLDVNGFTYNIASSYYLYAGNTYTIDCYIPESSDSTQNAKLIVGNNYGNGTEFLESGKFNILRKPAGITGAYSFNNYIQSGQPFNIGFQSIWVDSVNIDYSTDGMVWNNLLPWYKTYTGYNSPQLTLPYLGGLFKNSKIRISNNNVPAEAIIDNLILSDNPPLVYISPAKNQNYKAGKADTITVINYIPGVERLSVYYKSLYGYSEFIGEIKPVVEGVNKFVWNKSEYLSAGQYMIEINNPMIGNSISSDTFNILPADPKVIFNQLSTKYLVSGNTYELSWNKINVDSVKVFYSLDGGISWTFITDTNSYGMSWNVPQNIVGTYKNAQFRVESYINPAVTSYSEMVTISDLLPILFTKPIAGSILTAGTNIPINVQNAADGINGAVLYYRTSDTLSWNSGPYMSYLNSGYSSFNFGIPNNLQYTDKFQLAIYSYNTNSILGVSPIYTLNPAPPSINITSPKADDYWMKSMGYNYLYFDAVNVGNAQLLFTSDGGTTWNIIDTIDTYMQSNYYVDLSLYPVSVSCKFKLIVLNNPAIFSESNVFSIQDKSPLKFSMPVAGSSIKAGSMVLAEYNFAAQNMYNYNYQFSLKRYDNYGYSVYLKDFVPKKGVNSFTFSMPDTVSAGSGYYMAASGYFNGYTVTDTIHNITITPADPKVMVNAPWVNMTYWSNTFNQIYVSLVSVTEAKLEYSLDGITWNFIDTIKSTGNISFNYNWFVPYVVGVHNKAQFRLTQIGGAGVSAVSDNVRITNEPEHLSIESPVGGSEFKAGSSFPINFFCAIKEYNWSGNVEVSYDNGANYNNVKTFDTWYGLHITNAYIPDSLQNTFAKVRVSAKTFNDSLITVISDSFKILPANPLLEIYKPSPWEGNDQAFWVSKDTVEIQWGSLNVPIVRILYSTDNGINWNLLKDNISSPNRRMNNGNFNSILVKVPQVSGLNKNSLIKIESLDGKLFVTSKPITISEFAPKLNIIYPMFSDTIIAGSPVDIIFDNNGPARQLMCDLSFDNGQNWMPSVMSNHYSTGRNILTIPASNFPSYMGTNSTMLARIYAPENYNFIDSTGTFTILARPAYLKIMNPQTGWLVYTGPGFNKYANWESGHVSSVNIMYSNDNMVTWDTIGKFVPSNDGPNSYSNNQPWPEIESDQSFIKIEDATNASINDVVGPFTTTNRPDTIIFIYPTSTNTLTSNQGTELRFVYQGRGMIPAGAAFNLFYSFDNGISKYPIGTLNTNNYWAEQSTYIGVPSVDTVEYITFYVELETNTGIVSTASEPIKVTPVVPYINVSNPYYGQYWQSGTYQQVYYYSNISNEPVNIDLTLDNGATWQNLASFITGGSYYMQVPNVDSTIFDAQIRVTNSYKPEIFGISGQFTISSQPPSITVVKPSKGSVMYANNSYNVVFNYNGPRWYDGVDVTLISEGVELYTEFNYNMLQAGENQVYFHISDWVKGSNNCQIKVSLNNKMAYMNDGGMYGMNVFGISDTFTIIPAKPEIDVMSPYAGSIIIQGTPVDINWYSINVDSVVIEMTANNGLSWNNIGKFKTLQRENNVEWFVPDTFATDVLDCRIRVRNAIDSKVYDLSDYFIINANAPALSIVSPATGDTIKAGNKYYMKFNYTGASINSRAFVLYSSNAGNYWSMIDSIEGISKGLNYHLLDVPATLSATKYAKLKIVLNENISAETGLFNVQSADPSIVIYNPTSNDGYILSGSRVGINWNNFKAPSVNIDYSLDGGMTWKSIFKNYMALEGYNNIYWNVPLIAGLNNNAVVRIKDSYNDSPVAISKISISEKPGYIEIINPNENTVWVAGKKQIIDFNMIGLPVNTYLMYYLEIDGMNEPFMLGSPGEAMNYSLKQGLNSVEVYLPAWLPSSANARVFATNSYMDGTANGGNFITKYYSQPFKLEAAQPEITIYYPNQYTYLKSGMTSTVEFSAVNVSSVKIEYSLNNGLSWTSLKDNYLFDGHGQLDWIVPSVKGENNLIKISATDGTGVYTISAPFAISNTSDSIKLIIPNGGEIIYGGSKTTIKYYYSGAFAALALEYSPDNGLTWMEVDTIFGKGGINSHTLDVPFDVDESDSSLFRISDQYGVSDVSDAVFKLRNANALVAIDAPAYGERWMSGETRQIKWVNWKTDKVDIYYSVDSGATYLPIVAGYPAFDGDNSYSWQVPAVVGTKNAFVKIISVFDGNVKDSSDLFSISNEAIGFTINSPNGGEDLKSEMKHVIEVNYNGLNTIPVKLFLSPDNGKTWNQITDQGSFYAVPGLNKYSVYIPYTAVSSTSLVRIEDAKNPALYDVSNSVFKISAANSTITLFDPNSLSYWVAGNIVTIKWNSFNVTNVQIDYTLDSTIWKTVSSNVVSYNGSNSFNWKVENIDSIYRGSRIRVMNIADNSVVSVSDSFTMANRYPSSDATLAQLLVGGSNIEGFNADTLTYSYYLPFSATVPPVIQGVTNFAYAKAASVNGTTVPGTSWVDVTAEDGSTTKRYTVKFFRSSPSNDAFLSDLKVDGTTVSGFKPSVLNYTINLGICDTIIPEVTLATPTASGSTVAIDSAVSIPGKILVNVTSESGSATSQYTINITRQPFDLISDATISINENSANGSLVTTMPISNWVCGRPIQMSIDGGNSNNTFAIDNSGNITINDSTLINYETNNQFALKVKVVPVEDPSRVDSAVVTVNVQNVNEKPTLKYSTYAVNENIAAGTSVAILESADPENDPVLFSKVGNIDNFAVTVSSDGNIKVNRDTMFNYESYPVISVKVRVVEITGDSYADTAIVTINVSDVNEKPIAVDQIFAANEMSANGTVVGTIVASDPDNGQSLTYEIMGGNDDGIFGLDLNTGEITVVDNTNMNYEGNPNNPYSLSVFIKDDGTPKQVTPINVLVNLDDVNEAPKVNVATFNVNENASKFAVVGTVTATDPDALQTKTFSIIGGNVDSAFAISSAGQLTVYNPKAVNYEVNPTIEVVVGAKDNGTPSLTGSDTIIVNVLDKNDKPSLVDQSLYVLENTPNATIVDTVIASDEDAAQSLTYSLTFQSVSNVFTINASTGELVVNDATKLDFETTTVFTLKVKVKDNASTPDSTTATIKVYVQDVAEKGVTADFQFSYDNVNPRKVIFENLSSPNANAFYWVFGDGTTFKGDVVPHTYTADGIFPVCLTAVDNTKGFSDKICKDVQIGSVNCVMNADYTYGVDGLTLVFADQSAGDVRNWYWDFGDGNISTDQSPAHTFAQEGYYLVSLAVSDSSRKCVDYYSDLILVGSVECHASFDVLVDNTTKTATFTNTSEGAAKYYWDFDDGTFAVAKDPSRVYKKEGIYYVSLAIANASATCIDNVVIPVQVGNISCNAQFTYQVDTAERAVYFKDQVSGESTNELWSFGDGRISISKNPVHYYKNDGFYTVTLNTYNSTSKCMDYYEQSIQVGDPGADCEADFDYLVDDPATRITKFTDKSKGDINFWVWDFGDGVKAMGANASHTYATAGYYNVCLLVINSKDVYNITCKEVAIATTETNSCKADFDFNVDSTTMTAQFADATRGTVDKWEWTFGDNTGVSAIQSPSYKYTSSGYYLVSLKVSNTSTGCIDKTYKLVNVNQYNEDIKAGFGYDADEANTKSGDYPVDFVGAGCGDHARLRWDFGDGSSDTTSTTPTHVYTEAGTYKVCYEVSDPVTQVTDSVCEYVKTAQDVGIRTEQLTVAGLTNYPNPFCESTTISFELLKTSQVELSVIDFNGRRVETILKTTKAKGEHSFAWNAARLSKGAYILQLTTSDGKVYNKMIVKR